MKPDWSKAPKWATHLAQDKSGAWFWYDHAPVIVNDCRWADYADNIGSTSQLAMCAEDDWKDSLQARPSG